MQATSLYTRSILKASQCTIQSYVFYFLKCILLSLSFTFFSQTLGLYASEISKNLQISFWQRKKKKKEIAFEKLSIVWMFVRGKTHNKISGVFIVFSLDHWVHECNWMKFQSSMRKYADAESLA